MTVQLLAAEGNALRTANVERHNAESHIRANDQYATEAHILLAWEADDSEREPIAWKYADPTEDARLIYDAAELAAIEAEDASLIERVEVVYE